MIFPTFAGAAAFFLIFFSERASDAALSAMNSCAFTVIPSLFPYMAVSSLLVASGTAELLAKVFERPISFIFGVPGSSVSAMLLGLLCGFPVGAKTSVNLYKEGLITDYQTEHLVAVSNNTGPAFVIEVAGRKYFGSAHIGLIFYLVQLASAFLVATVYGIADRKRLKSCGNYLPRANEKHSSSAMACLSSAISDAARASVSVSGFIVFFSVISSYISMLGEYIGLSATKLTVISALLEFSGAVRDSASVGGMIGLCIASFAINFSGISVLAQSASLTDGEPISITKCAVSKFIQGIVSVVITCVLYYLGIFSHEVPQMSILPTLSGKAAIITRFTLAVTLIFITAMNRKRKVFGK